MKNLLNFEDYSPNELEAIIESGIDLKKNPAKYASALSGKKLYLLFEKTSTRTFLSFAAGITEMGGCYFNQKWEDSNFSLADPISEIQYVGRNVDIIMARLKQNDKVRELAKYSSVPFINGCDNTFHPCQALGDIMTVKEIFGRFDINLMYIGAKNNVFNSLLEISGKLGVKLYGYTPLVNAMAVGEDFYASKPYTDLTNKSFDEVKTLIKKMDVVYTDAWVDMEFFNNPAYAGAKQQAVDKMLPYQLNESLLEESRALVFHDMPIHEGYEISRGVIDANIATILNQAENRRHIEKAIMLYLLGAK
ncbi:MAG: ornithine carbamoyltransferase [Oscillospiraceae bacterium]|jgi:ornithine carbamoyltransferase|nr:ornithine carbamoyltransferase [Oscillospiraceae bacterium]